MGVLWASVLLAGCFGGSDEPGAPVVDEEEEDSAPVLVNESHDGRFTAGAWPVYVEPLEFGVPPEAQALLVELRWSADAATMGLEAWHSSCHPATVDQVLCRATGEDESVHRVEGDALPADGGELSLLLDRGSLVDEDCFDTGRDACRWLARARPVASVYVEYDLRVTVLVEGELPEGFSAFDQ